MGVFLTVVTVWILGPVEYDGDCSAFLSGIYRALGVLAVSECALSALRVHLECTKST